MLFENYFPDGVLYKWLWGYYGIPPFKHVIIIGSNNISNFQISFALDRRLGGRVKFPGEGE